MVVLLLDVTLQSLFILPVDHRCGKPTKTLVAYYIDQCPNLLRRETYLRRWTGDTLYFDYDPEDNSLQRAIRDNDQTSLRRWLQWHHPSDIDYPLILAGRYNRPAIVRIIVDHIQKSHENPILRTWFLEQGWQHAFWSAFKHGHVDLLRWILEQYGALDISCHPINDGCDGLLSIYQSMNGTIDEAMKKFIHNHLRIYEDGTRLCLSS